jgi:hypothetical protein
MALSEGLALWGNKSCNERTAAIAAGRRVDESERSRAAARPHVSPKLGRSISSIVTDKPPADNVLAG